MSRTSLLWWCHESAAIRGQKAPLQGTGGGGRGKTVPSAQPGGHVGNVLERPLRDPEQGRRNQACPQRRRAPRRLSPSRKRARKMLFLLCSVCGSTSFLRPRSSGPGHRNPEQPGALLVILLVAGMKFRTEALEGRKGLFWLTARAHDPSYGRGGRHDQQECEAAGHVAPAVRKQREMNLMLSGLCVQSRTPAQGAEPRPRTGWISPSQ